MRRHSVTVLIILLAIGVTGYASASDSQPLSLPELIAEALAVNPDVAALRSRIESLGHRVKPAEALPDPAVGLMLMGYPVDTNPFDIGRLDMTQTQLSYSQMLPAPGVRRLRGELAKRDIEIGSAQLLGKQVEIAVEISRAYLDLYLESRKLEIARATAGELERITQIARSRYEAGQGNLRDVLTARLAQQRLETAIKALEQRRGTAKAMINAILDRSPDSPLADTPSELETTEVSFDFAEAMNRALGSNPALRNSKAELDKNSVATELAQKELQPDYGLMFAYGLRYDLPDLWTAGVTINLPLWRGDKQRERLTEAQAEERVALAILQAEKNRTAFALRKALDEIRCADDQIALHRDSNIPLARMALESSLTAYQADRADLDALLGDQIALWELELELEMTIVERELSVVDLKAALGSIASAAEGAVEPASIGSPGNPPWDR